MKTRLPKSDVENKPDMDGEEEGELMLMVSSAENKADGPILPQHEDNKSIE